MENFKVDKIWSEITKNVDLVNEDRTVKFNLKWDGCVNLWTTFNGSTIDDNNEDNTQYIHICDLDEFIEQLQEVRDFATKHFNNKYWRE